ncbi:MAG: NAD(P)/FAD-dependent oxidoreductase [Bacillota bacterium]
MKKLLLAGGGHSHIQVLKRLKEEPLKDVDITLISPSKYQYCPELFPGYSEDRYEEKEVRVDLKELAENAGVNWKEGAVLSIDPGQKLALTAEGEILKFDIISLNIGSMTSGTDKISLSDNIYTIKPNYQFTTAVKAVRGVDNPVIIGGNAAAVEIASSVQAWRTKQNIHNPITVIAQNRLLPEMEEYISDEVARRLRGSGIILYEGETLKKMEENKVFINSKEIPFSKLLWLQNPKAPDLFRLSKLPVDENGYLSIEKTLQVKEYPFIFGAGEGAVIKGHQLSTHSLYTSRKQGNVLFTNIRGFLDTGEGELVEEIHIPILLELGNKQGFAVFRNRPLFGRIPWALRQIQNKKLLKN